MTTLQYRSHAQIEDLALGDCTIRRTSDNKGSYWWELWFYVARETDGVAEDFAVPVNPGGGYVENGPGGKTWGLTRSGAGVWQVSPSINVVNDADARAILAGQCPQGRPSLWHQTPALVDVPEDEPWIPK